MTDSAWFSNAAYPQLVARDAGWFITYAGSNAEQVLLWLDPSGNSLAEHSVLLPDAQYAFASGEQVNLVQRNYDFPWVIVHSFDSSGTETNVDTLMDLSQFEGESVLYPAMEDANGELLMALPTLTYVGDTASISERIIRYTPGDLSVGEPWELTRYQDSDSIISWYSTDDEFCPGGGILAYSLVEDSRDEVIRVASFDLDGLPLATIELGRWTQMYGIWTTGISARVANGSVYACSVKATPGGPYLPAVYVEAFPLADFQLADRAHTPVPSLHSLIAYPNPFNSATQISFDLPRSGPVQIVITDITGRLTGRATNGYYTAGTHTVSFDASDLASGIYFATLSSGSATQTQKLVLLK